ncbi:hypothetical protein BDP27DRAFT_1418407 [Rhodocollybia butyracea]|uniref:DUF6534 domain-containing protein n=1 Tax=Rhodocollybia butyracea TaxID=206335 RepID=A0A9P5U9J5_9AGAR|nr:hypothetical protein BDP27DRAFT_1418407 [Rhodocollybia butyracea]
MSDSTIWAQFISLSFGPMLVGVFLNCILYGVLSVQTFIYFQTYKSDSPRIKALLHKFKVWYLYIMETLNTGFDMGLMFGAISCTPEALTRVPIMLSADPIVTVLISTPVQIFMAWRIKIIRKSSWLMWIIIFSSICSFIGGIANTILITIINEYANIHQFNGSVITGLVSTAITDIMITCSLVWSLWKSRTNVRATDDAITRIIRCELTVQTGLITALSAILDIILFLAIPVSPYNELIRDFQLESIYTQNTTINFVWDFALSKLYTNALISTLNARHGWGNLNGPTIPGNSILFQDSGGTDINTAISFNRPNARIRNSDTGIITTDVYELSIAEQWVNTQTNMASVKGDPDKVIGSEQDLESYES